MVSSKAGSYSLKVAIKTLGLESNPCRPAIDKHSGQTKKPPYETMAFYIMFYFSLIAVLSGVQYTLQLRWADIRFLRFLFLPDQPVG